jgi:phosphatidylinositol alpha-1,6-mannosyltransferase
MPFELPGLDILIAPSQSTGTWREQFGRMLIEAMASGVPVISSDSGEIPHTVGDAGSIVRESDVQGFSQAVKSLLGSCQLQQELCGKGLARSRLFSVETLAPQYAAFWAKSFCN